VSLYDGSCNDIGCDQLWTMCWISSCVECCGDHAHQSLSCLYIRIESDDNFCAPRAFVKTARQNIGYGIFFGHENVGNWLGVEYQHRSLWNPTSTDQKREFSVYKQGFMNFMLMTTVLSDSESCHERVFVVHILLVNLCEQAYEYVFNKNSTFRWSDQHVATPTVLTRRVVVISHRHRPWRRWRLSCPPKPKCCAKSYRRSSKLPNRCNKDLQWELITMDRRCLPPTLSSSEWSPQLS
jgi:hypothetical protein